MSQRYEQDNGSIGIAADTPGPQMFPSLGKITYTAMLEPDTQFGQFLIRQYLGGRSLWDTYRAYDTARGHDVTIEVIDVGLRDIGVPSEQLQGELAAYDRVQDHRHVLKVYGLDVTGWGGSQFLVVSMEWAEGGTLRDWLERHIDDQQTRRTEGLVHFRHACEGVAVVHQAGMSNLDLRPENLSFVRDEMKVSPTGQSPLIRSLVRNRSSSSEDRSEVSHRDQGTQSDIYSLGVLLCEIVYPQGRWLSSDIGRRLGSFPCPPDVTETEARIIGRCLDENPGNRYQTVRDLLDDLEGRLDGLSAAAERQHVERLWQRACRCAEEGRFDDAEHLCRQLCSRRPDHEDAGAMLRELDRRRKQADGLYGAIEQGLDDRNLDELGALLTEAVQTYPGHPGGHVIQVRLGEKSRQYRQVMQEGAAAICRGDWTEAHSWFQEAQRLNPGSLQVRNAAHCAARILEQQSESRRFIDGAIASGDYGRAMALARNLDDYLDAMARKMSAGQGGENV